MGCDIHMWVERLEDDGHWHLVPDAHVVTWRSYTLFAWLAGVRREEPKPIVAPRGWPDDLSEELRAYFKACEYGKVTPLDARRLDSYMDGDGHTESWLLVSELEAASEFGRALPEGIGGFYEDFVYYWSRLGVSSSHVRIVFNFDN